MEYLLHHTLLLRDGSLESLDRIHMVPQNTAGFYSQHVLWFSLGWPKAAAERSQLTLSVVLQYGSTHEKCANVID